MVKCNSEATLMIKAVLIDIDDTVLDFQKCAEWSIKTAMSERGVQYAAEMYPVFKEVNDRLWSELEKGNITRENIFDRRFSEIFDKLGLSLDGREFEARFIELLHESTEEVSEARALLEYLHGKKYRIYAVSNAMQFQQENRLKKGGLEVFFDGIYTSELLGAAKPSREFFDAFFARVPEISKNEVLLIGDSLTADIAGGKNYGLTTCWFNNGARHSSSGSFSDFVVTSLSSIKLFM